MIAHGHLGSLVWYGSPNDEQNKRPPGGTKTPRGGEGSVVAGDSLELPWPSYAREPFLATFGPSLTTALTGIPATKAHLLLESLQVLSPNGSDNATMDLIRAQPEFA